MTETPRAPEEEVPLVEAEEAPAPVREKSRRYNRLLLALAVGTIGAGAVISKGHVDWSSLHVGPGKLDATDLKNAPAKCKELIIKEGPFDVDEPIYCLVKASGDWEIYHVNALGDDAVGPFEVNEAQGRYEMTTLDGSLYSGALPEEDAKILKETWITFDVFN